MFDFSFIPDLRASYAFEELEHMEETRSPKAPVIRSLVFQQAFAHALFHDLTEKQRRVVQLYYFDNLTVTAIAKKLSVNKSTVSRTLHRALDKLEDALRDYA